MNSQSKLPVVNTRPDCQSGRMALGVTGVARKTL